MKTIGIAGPCRSKAVKLGVDDDKITSGEA